MNPEKLVSLSEEMLTVELDPGRGCFSRARPDGKLSFAPLLMRAPGRVPQRSCSRRRTG